MPKNFKTEFYKNTIGSIDSTFDSNFQIKLAPNQLDIVLRSNLHDSRRHNDRLNGKINDDDDNDNNNNGGFV